MIDLWLGEEDAAKLTLVAEKLKTQPAEILLKLVQRIDPDFALNGSVVFTCSCCGLPFWAPPRPGVNRYCADCKETGKAEVDRVRRWRHRKQDVS
jgi:hypothetical protein